MKPGKLCVVLDEDWPERLESLFDDDLGWPDSTRVKKGSVVMFIRNIPELDDRLCVIRIPDEEGEWVTEKACLVALDDYADI